MSFANHYYQNQIIEYIKNPRPDADKWKNIIIVSKNPPKITKDNKIVIPYEQVDLMLKKLYDDPTTGLKSVDKMYQFVKNYFIGISKVDIDRYIKNTETNQLHTKQIKQNVRKPIVPKGINTIIHADLIDMIKYAELNNGINFLLTVIDSFSKYAWIEPLKNKEGKTVADAMNKIIQSMSKAPKSLITDNGSEFISDEFQKVITDNNMTHIKTKPYNPRANGAIERFNQTIKKLISRYMTHFKTKHYIGALDKLVENYNQTPHSVIVIEPSQAQELKTADSETIDLIYGRIQSQAESWLDKNEELPFTEINVGDYVRLSADANKTIRKNKIFFKGYEKQWSVEIYKVAEIKLPSSSSQPEIYKLSLDGEDIQSDFYRDQLLKIDIDKLKRTERTNIDHSDGKIFNRERLLVDDLPNRPVIENKNELPVSALEERKQNTNKRVRKPNRRYED